MPDDITPLLLRYVFHLSICFAFISIDGAALYVILRLFFLSRAATRAPHKRCCSHSPRVVEKSDRHDTRAMERCAPYIYAVRRAMYVRLLSFFLPLSSFFISIFLHCFPGAYFCLAIFFIRLLRYASAAIFYAALWRFYPFAAARSMPCPSRRHMAGYRCTMRASPCAPSCLPICTLRQP